MELNSLLLALVTGLALIGFVAFYYSDKKRRNEERFLKSICLGLTEQCIRLNETRDALKRFLGEEIQMAQFGGYSELGPTTQTNKARTFYLFKLNEARAILNGTHQLASAGGQSPKTKIVDLAQYKSNNRQKKDNSRQK